MLTQGRVPARLLQVIQCLIQHELRIDLLRHFVLITSERYQFLRGRHINSVDVAEADGRRRRGDKHMLRARLSNGLLSSPAKPYIHNHHRGIPADNRVIHDQHRESFQCILLIRELHDYMNRVMLDLDALLADLLGRHDERAGDVAVLRQTLDVSLAQCSRDLVITE